MLIHTTKFIFVLHFWDYIPNSIWLYNLHFLNFIYFYFIFSYWQDWCTMTFRKCYWDGVDANKTKCITPMLKEPKNSKKRQFLKVWYNTCYLQFHDLFLNTCIRNSSSDGKLPWIWTITVKWNEVAEIFIKNMW